MRITITIGRVVPLRFAALALVTKVYFKLAKALIK